MALDLVWRFSSRQRAADFLWALLSVGRASGWRHLLVAVDRRERVEVGISFDELITEGRVEWVTRLLERGRHKGVTVDDLVEDPWQWRELYLDGGVRAFRWWQGVGPGEGPGLGHSPRAHPLPRRHIRPGEVAAPPRGGRRGRPPARNPGPGRKPDTVLGTRTVLVLVRRDRTIYREVNKRRKRRRR